MSIIGQGIMLGTFVGNYQTKTVIPNASTQLITPDSGYDALANITITGDSNFTASNIVNGVTIWGITGTYLPSLSSTTVTPNGASFTITPSGTVVGFNQISVVGDANLTAANIKSGIIIYGIQGTYKPLLQTKIVTPNAAGFNVIPDSSYYGLEQVTVNGETNLTAENIKSGVSMFGIAGSYAPSLQSKSVIPNAAGFTVTPDSSYYGLSQVVVSGNANLTASNIKSGVSIFGITGSYAPSLQTKTVTPNAAGFTVTNDSGYYGLSSVTVNGDSNLTASNIKSGTKIFGVTGTYQGGGSTQIGVVINQLDTGNKPTSITIASGNLWAHMFYNNSTTAGYWTNVTTLTNFDSWNLGTTIPVSTFYNCNKFTFSTWPTITTISNYSFYNCKNLKCPQLPASTSLNVGNYAFSGCNGLTWTEISTCNRVNSYAFNGCTNLGPKMKIKAKYISRNMFNGCTNITKVWIASRCTNLFGTVNAITGPFYYCSKLTDIYVEATAKPSNFNSYWGYVNASCQPTIHYSTTESAFDALS